MINNQPNPFQILELPTNASDEVIVKRGARLLNTATSEEQRQLYQWAIDELTTHAFTRQIYELCEVPNTAYRDPAWETFVKKHKRNPAKQTALATVATEVAPLNLADFNLTMLVELLLDALLSVPPADIAPAVQHSPFVPDPMPLPLEVQDVIFG